MKRVILAALFGVLLFAAPVAAAQPVVTASIVINQSPVSFGDAVTFTTVVPRGTKNPWISVTCYQAGVLVYGEGNAAGSTFALGGASSAWVDNGGGPADCHAELGDLYSKSGQQVYTKLAEITFPAV